MNRKNTARIGTITQIEEIEDNNDFVIGFIDKGWQVVFEKGNYNVNDKVTFIPSGSWVPDELLPIIDAQKYKGVKGGYLTVMKRGGHISEGIVLDADKYNDNLEVRIWERDLPEEFECKDYRTYPSFIPKIEYSYAQDIAESIFTDHYSESFEITPRLDGVEMTVYVKNGRFGLCSEKYDITETTDNAFWKFARQLNLIDPMINYRDQYAIHGTIVGEGIYSNHERVYGERKFYIHDIYDIEKSAFSTSKERYQIFSDLAEYCKFDHVGIFKHSMPLFEVASNIRELVNYANGPSMSPLTKRKGLIFKSNDSDFKFKVKSNNFCIANKL
jgi:RNA ligase (TIGR02306 family)